MYVLGYFLQALAGVIHVILMTATIIVIARAVLSWVSPDPYNPIVRIINQMSEPLLFPVRRRVPYISGIDFSPMIVLLALMFVDNFLVPSLQRIAVGLIQGG
ncbi:YggT family protein [Mariprofundus erugo]|uniref:YggT family protein n=1 Tax=Mariprofundus erugo TaxID=2528639 RepID=A0A5R9GL98_9PROT|nr:YggT family protein [Mariprofundus erugo]TLS67256.1 YggT family protein [Mariprofundus erugo]TLS76511.1 YggT family protein [Mariprofundus erugo]